MTAVATASFSRGIRDLHGGKVLSPILRGELMKPTFRSFSVKVQPFTPRPPDGWFHPSEHSAWPARQLTLYLRHPEAFEQEETTLEKVLAVTQGHFFHGLMGQVFTRNGILLMQEVYKEDKLHNRRGHMDGFLATNEGLEFKTVNNDWLLKKIVDVDSLREYKPGYYAQIQDYLDMHELTAMRFLMMGMFYPYPMIEFPIFYDEPYQLAQRAKYREALERVGDGAKLPEPCCAPRSKIAKACPLRTVCPIGRAALGLK